jgi:cyclophilin family peptidyl-prolyl cis-trans isomerase
MQRLLPILLPLVALFALVGCNPATPPAAAVTGDPPPAAEEAVLVDIVTSQGTIRVALDPAKAPKTVDNFLAYADSGFYDGTIFHRVIRGFMIQGGGLDAEMNKKETRAPVENEARNGLQNRRGTIAMARTGDPHSATAQFFINHGNNANLDYPSFDGWGYAVFGTVVDGMDVVDAIAGIDTTTRNGREDVPVDIIRIESIARAD